MGLESLGFVSQFLWRQRTQKRAGGPEKSLEDTRLFIYFDRWNLVLII